MAFDQIYPFQFLDRNSFGSDVCDCNAEDVRESVSIPRSEFFRFGLLQRVPLPLKRPGFQFLDRNSFGSDQKTARLQATERPGFNSSIGILSVRTLAVIEGLLQDLRVSIPRSEFFRFGHGDAGPTVVSQVGFQFLDRNSFGSDIGHRSLRSACTSGFNSSIGILSVRTLQHLPQKKPQPWFQFLDRNSFGSDMVTV